MLSWDKNTTVPYVLVLLITLIVYSNTLFNGYNLDDELVTINHKITSKESGAPFKQIFTSSYSLIGEGYGYRPITTASFYLEHRLLGESPFTSHLINLLLYSSLCLLVLKVLRIFFEETNIYILTFIALLFVVHPLHSEVVASIKNRDEILSLLFLSCAIWSSHKWLFRNKFYLLVLTFIFVCLSLLSKKSCLPILFILPTLLYLKHAISLKRFVYLLVSIGTPLLLLVFNFNLKSGVVLFLGFLLLHFIVFYLSGVLVQKNVSHKTFSSWFAFGLITLLLLWLGTSKQELVLWLFSLLVLLVLINRHFKIYYLGMLFFSLLGFFVFEKIEIVMNAVLVLSSSVFYVRNDKRSLITVGVAAIILASIASFFKQDPKYILIYLLPFVIFYSSSYKVWLAPLLAVSMMICSFVFGFFNVFVLGTLIFSFLPTLKARKAIQISRISITVIWLVIFTFFMVGKHLEVNDGLTRSIEEVKRLEASKSFENTQLNEGRKLEFVENTLVAPHTLEESISTGLLVMGKYLQLMIFPRELSFYYGYSKIVTTNFYDYKVWISLLSYLLLFYCAIYFFKKQLLISIGAIWFISCILLFSNLPVLVAGMVGERLAFCASVGFCIMIGGFLNWIKPNLNFKRPRVWEMLSILLLVAFSVRTISRNSKWESATTLMNNDIEHLNNSASANYLLGVHTTVEAIASGETINRKELEKAAFYMNRAIDIYPMHYNFHLDLGKTHIMLGDLESAKGSLVNAHLLEPNATSGMLELVNVCFELEQHDEVVRYGLILLKKNNKNATITKLVAFSAHFSGDYKLSDEKTRLALQYEPDNADLKRLNQENQKLLNTREAD